MSYVMRLKRATTAERLGCVASLVAVVTFAVSVGAWVNNKIDRTIESRIEPYESLLVGMAFVENDQSEEAVPHLDKALDELTKRLTTAGGSRPDLQPVVDYYLYAVVNSAKPDDYGVGFGKITRAIAENQVPTNAYREHHIGWYHFRTGDPQKARVHFEKAIRLFRADEQYVNAGDAYWALALMDVERGDVASALANAHEARTRNPTSYDPTTANLTLAAVKEDPWYVRLTRMYPKFDATLPTFLKQLDETSMRQRT